MPPGDLPSEMSEENFPKDPGSLRERMLKGPDSSQDSENFKDQVFSMKELLTKVTNFLRNW